jgi:acetyltransferase-like isoleucine patch superfamily enzyme/acyl carrier protein
MRRLGQIADDPKFVGIPYLKIAGSIHVGKGFALTSEPVPSHLVVDRGAHLEIGDHVRVGDGCGIACSSHISIGSHSVLGTHVMVIDNDFHVPGDTSANSQPLPIAIGDNVKVGDKVTILRGARIEDDAVIEANSVVSGLVPRGTRVSGVPARGVSVRHGDLREDSVEGKVLGIAQQIFRLATRPKLSDGPIDIKRWDSLGALLFLLELESGLKVNLSVDEAGKVRTLADVVELVQRSADRAQRQVG